MALVRARSGSRSRASRKPDEPRPIAARAILALESRTSMGAATAQPGHSRGRAVNDPSPSPSPSLRPTRPRWAAVAVAILILAGIAWAIRTSMDDRPRRRAALASATSPPTPPTSTPARGSPTSATRRAPAAIARSPRPIAATRWAGRSPPSTPTPPGPPIGAAAGLPFESKGVRYTVERRDGRTIHKARRQASDGSRVRRGRGRGPLRPRLGDARHRLPDRARRLPLPVADRLVRAAGALGHLARLRRVHHAAELRAADPARLPGLPRQPVPPRGRDVEPLRVADLPGPRHRVRAMPRPGRAARRRRRAIGRVRLDDRQPGRPGPRAAGIGLPAMPPPGLVPLRAGGPRAARLPPGTPLAPVRGGLPDEEGGPG